MGQLDPWRAWYHSWRKARAGRAAGGQLGRRMIEVQVQSTVDGAILHDAALGVAPDAGWFEPGRWPLAADADTSGRGGVPFLVTPIGTCALRHYRRGGLVARLVADRYLWTGAERTRA